MEFHGAILTKKEGGHFINIGLSTCKKLKIKEGSKVMATFSVDKSAYQFEMPEELKEVLVTDHEAQNLSFANQRQSTWTHLFSNAGKIKREEN